MGGQEYCGDCYNDLGFIENDFEHHVRDRVPEGRCATCGGEVVDGEYVDEA